MKTKQMAKKPRNEQETIITYDVQAGEWHLYTDYPPHARKYERHVVASDTYESYKGYAEDTGELIVLSGKINGSAGINSKRELTDEQRQKISERVKNMHAKRKGNS